MLGVSQLKFGDYGNADWGKPYAASRVSYTMGPSYGLGVNTFLFKGSKRLELGMAYNGCFSQISANDENSYEVSNYKLHLLSGNLGLEIMLNSWTISLGGRGDFTIPRLTNFKRRGAHVWNGQLVQITPDVFPYYKLHGGPYVCLSKRINEKFKVRSSFYRSLQYIRYYDDSYLTQGTIGLSYQIR